MSKHEFITPQTNDSLKEAAAKYEQSVAIPHFVADVNGFACVYLGDERNSFGTLISMATSDSLSVVLMKDEDYPTDNLLVNIDISGRYASIVAPGFCNGRGEIDARYGSFQRPIVRSLTEREGQELAMDLYALIARTIGLPGPD